MSDLPVRYHCRHVHPSGHRCGSPALRGEPFCYHHHTTRAAAAPRDPFPRSLLIPALEDRATLQLALSKVLDQVANGMLDLPSARVLLYGLQIAQSNLPPHKLAPKATETVEEITLDERLQPLAPEQEFLAAPHERTLEEILVEQWEQDKAERAEEQAAREAHGGNRYPAAIVPALNASQSCSPGREHRSGYGAQRGHVPPNAAKPRGRMAIGALELQFLFGTAACCTCLVQDYAGDHLISHTLTRAVPSAQRGLTSVFGMGTGVTLAVNSPANYRTSRERSHGCSQLNRLGRHVTRIASLLRSVGS